MRIAYLSLALPLALAACGDDGGDSRADASITIQPDSAVADANVTEPDADTTEPDADTTEPDADTTEGARLIISEVVDGDLTGGQPKFVEITNTGDAAADLSGYSIGMYANGGTTLAGLNGGAAYVLSGTLEPGDSVAVNFDSNAEPGASTFLTVYGEEPDFINQSFSFNGDDALVLFDGAATGDGSDATVVDVFGEIGVDAEPDTGVDGDEAAWYNIDSYSVRRPGSVTPTATFDAEQWVINPPRTLDGLDAAQHDAATSPGVHSFTR